MGVRAAIVVCATSFLLGFLFTHWIADSLTLWKSPVTDEHLWTAASYYHILAKGPTELWFSLVGVVSVGGVTILWSFRNGEASNLMFDGGSIVFFATAVGMYFNFVMPTVFETFSQLPVHRFNDPFPRALRVSALELASTNLVCSVALTGVLALQAARFFAERADEEDDELYVDDNTKLQRTRENSPVPNAS
jgi:hypothetical protein